MKVGSLIEQKVTIFERVLADIKCLKDISSLRLIKFHLASPFTVVQLSDRSIGSAGNYDIQNHTTGYNPMLVKVEYERHLKKDPLLLQTLQDDQSWVGLSLRTAILSALSQSLLQLPILSKFELTCCPIDNRYGILDNYSQVGDIVTIVGFGGCLDAFCRLDKIKHIYVCDFIFNDPKYRDIAWQHIKGLTTSPMKVTLVDGASSEQVISMSNVCSITGSALCNSTLEALLIWADKCREVIIQGPSCSLLPVEFFRRSATLILTTIKTKAELEAGQHPGDRIYKVVDQHYIAISSLK